MQRLLAFALLAFWYWLIPAPAEVRADDILLKTGIISGNIRVGSAAETAVLRADIFANFQTYTAQTSVSPNSPTGTYELTVSIPEGVTAAYQTTADLYFDSYRDRISFGARTVNVSEGAASTLNFAIDQPGFVEGVVTVTGSGALSSAKIVVSTTYGTPITSTTTTTAATSGQFRVPVVPRDNMIVSGTVTLTGGAEVAIAQRYINVAPGQTVTVPISVTPPTTGTLETKLQITGDTAVNYYQLQISGPASRVAKVYGPFGPDNFTDHLFTNLPAGTYNLSVRAFTNGTDDELLFPSALLTPTNRPVITAGKTTIIEAAGHPTFINGAINLTGSASLRDLSSLSISALGLSGEATAGGYAADKANLTDGTFDLIVSEGPWKIDTLSFSFLRADPYLQENLYFSDTSGNRTPIALSSGQTVSRSFDYATGESLIVFKSTDGRTFSSPRLRAACTKTSPSGELLSTFSANSYSILFDVTEASVRLIGMEGSCEVIADAYISGSLTTFGQRLVKITPGASGAADLGGPALTIAAPYPDDCVGTDRMPVSGTASDDTAVESITVNGSPAAIESANNPSDPHEVRFSAEVPLTLGYNEVFTVAADTSSKTASDRRRVLKDVDSDLDGVLNCRDACSADSQKTAPDICGCGTPDTDTDGDGFADCLDQCFQDASKQSPGICGCGISDADSDGDGTADCHDLCTADPAKVAPGACGCGTPDTDADGDGFADCLDQCFQDASKQSPGICGCGISDADSDGDGTADCHDLCTADPAKVAPGACGCGTSDVDSDNDETADCHDLCPADSTKLAPGICGCGTSDVDSDGDGTADCRDECPGNAQLTKQGPFGCQPVPADNDGDGLTTEQGDCDDQDGSVHPGAPELCDAKDNDCNKLIDDSSEVHVHAELRSYNSAGKPVVTPLGAMAVAIYSSETPSCLKDRCASRSGSFQQCVEANCRPVAQGKTDSAGNLVLRVAGGHYTVFAGTDWWRNVNFPASSSACGQATNDRHITVTIQAAKKQLRKRASESTRKQRKKSPRSSSGRSHSRENKDAA